MSLIGKAQALLSQVRLEDLEALSPVERRRLADSLRHLAELADACGRRVKPEVGVLQALKYWRGHE
jgi:hypothetical protein